MTIQSSIFGTFCIRVLAAWSIVHGMLTCIGGSDRWINSVYDIVELIPGAPYTWGIALIIGGLLALSASLLGIEFSKKIGRVNINYSLLKNVGLWIIGATCFCFFLGLIGVAITHPDISFTVGDRDLLICVLCIMMTKATEPSYKKMD